MKVHNLFVSLAMSFFLTAALFAQHVKTDYGRTAAFDQYKTYSWQKVVTKNPLWVDRIKSAVDFTRCDRDHEESTDAQYVL